ncbi:MAG: hypothetical protein AAGH64_06065 [Planctomycetota bacterium]
MQDEPANTPPTSGPPPAPTSDEQKGTPQQQPRKGSTLGAVALLLSTLGVGGCLTVSGLAASGVPEAFFGLPATALLSLAGFATGVLAYFRADKRSPRGGIIGATFLGVVGGAIQTSTFVGMLIQFLPIRAQVAPLVEEVLAWHDAGDTGAIGGVMGAGAIASSEADEILGFFDRVEEEVGAIDSVRIEFESISRAGLVMKDYPLAKGGDPSGLTLPKPMELVYSDDGFVLLGVWLDEDALKDERVLIDDLIAFLPDERLLVLRDDGPAWDLANQFSVRVIRP